MIPSNNWTLELLITEIWLTAFSRFCLSLHRKNNDTFQTIFYLKYILFSLLLFFHSHSWWWPMLVESMNIFNFSYFIHQQQTHLRNVIRILGKKRINIFYRHKMYILFNTKCFHSISKVKLMTSFAIKDRIFRNFFFDFCRH